MVKVKLLDAEPTLAQQLLIGFWTLNLGLVIFIAVSTAHYGDLAGWLDAIGMVFGVLAVYFALTQFMLMGRVGWIEKHFGLEHLASYHRINGYLAISCILIHPLFITVSYALAAHIGPVRQYSNLIFHYSYVWMALIAEILFITVVASSIYITRKRLKFETWYFVHICVYAAIVLAAIHPFFVSDSFSRGEHPLAIAYWLALYGFVAINLLVWRFGLSTFNFLRFRFRVEKVVAETPTTTSVYIHARSVQRLHAKAGQFVLVRFLTKEFWWQEHPFSLSWLPHDDLIRLTIRHVGDYTTAIERLKPGAYVWLSGPFGRFTSSVAQTKKRLYIAGGVGITPIRTLIEEGSEQDGILLYANRNENDVVFAGELKKLKIRTKNVYSEPSADYRGEKGYIDAGRVRRLVPDFKHRDVYLCGPPPMMEGLISGLITLGLKPSQLHYERFALHSK